MSSEPQRIKVSKLQGEGCILVEDGNHGEYRPRPDEFGSGETAFIRAADMADGRVVFESAEHINEVAVRRIRKGIGRGGDILFSHKGTVGKLAVVPVNAPPFVCSPQTTFWRTLDEDRLDRRYLYYFMCSQQFTDQWHARKGETDMADYVSLTAQRELYVDLPEIGVQRAIGRFLGALNDKIELNRRMNRTLEAMAQALFQSWFVDFDPVIAKAAGRDPSVINASTASLFPVRFIESERGPIPEGWTIGNLGDCAELKRGYDLPSRQREYGYIKIISSSGHSGFHSKAMVKGPGVVTGRYGTIGEVFYVEDDFWPLNTTLYVRDFKGHEPRFIEGLLKTVNFDRYSDKAAVPGVNRNDLHIEMVVIPPPSIERQYAKSVESLWKRHTINARECLLLSNLRDGLMPRLLSGEISLSQAAKVIEATL